jgi:hypothetical protein
MIWIELKEYMYFLWRTKENSKVSFSGVSITTANTTSDS